MGHGKKESIKNSASGSIGCQKKCLLKIKLVGSLVARKKQVSSKNQPVGQLGARKKVSYKKITRWVHWALKTCFN